MKKIFHTLVCCIIGLNTIAQYQATCNYNVAISTNDGNCILGDWTLVFEDEFNGNHIDNNKWYTHYGYGTRCHIDGNQVFLDENITVANGILTLTLNENPDYYDCEWGNMTYKQYAAGMIWSKSSYIYGIFEAKIKIPKGTNYWPAFWLWGVGGEIDIFEFYDDETAPVFSTHKWPEEMHQFCTYTHHGLDYSSDYHTYTTLWDPYYIAFFIDGDLKYVHWLVYTTLGQTGVTCENLQALNQYMFSNSYPSNQEKEHIIINHAAQSDTPNPLPSDMLVEYVRVWQKTENTCVDKTINQFDSTCVKGKTITVDGDIDLNSEENITLVAQNEIVINSGLIINSGATFEAKIEPNLCSNPTIRSAITQTEPMINFSQIDSIKMTSFNIVTEDYQDIILLHPNPVSNQLKICVEESGKIEILDIYGNLLVLSNIESGTSYIDMSNYSTGLYIIRYKSGGRIIIKKIMKQ